jgi:hypothetical protein
LLRILLALFWIVMGVSKFLALAEWASTLSHYPMLPPALQPMIGLYLPGLPAAWTAAHSQIRYVPVLSDAEPADAWHGRSGLVHRAVLEDHADLAAFQVYACGAPAMIDAARADFIAHGLPPEEFFADAFTFMSPPLLAGTVSPDASATATAA